MAPCSLAEIARRAESAGRSGRIGDGQLSLILLAFFKQSVPPVYLVCVLQIKWPHLNALRCVGHPMEQDCPYPP